MTFGFLEFGQKQEQEIEMEAGWYQDADGGLYHFDGSVWDVVPESFAERLEQLG